MSIVGDNIRALREIKGITQDQLADIVGVSRVTVVRWETGSFSDIRDSNIQRIRDYFKLTVDDLRSETNGLAAQLSSNGVGKRTISVSSSDDGMVELRSLDKVHAGTLADEEDCERSVEVPRSVLERHPHSYALLVEGDCMNKVVPEGYHVLVDPDLEPRNGSIAIVESQDYQAVMRRWYRFQAMLVLQADSYSQYDDIVLHDDDGPITVKGTVVWCQSSKEMD